MMHLVDDVINSRDYQNNRATGKTFWNVVVKPKLTDNHVRSARMLWHRYRLDDSED